MKGFLYGMSGLFMLIGIIHAFANLQNEILVWLFFVEENMSLFKPFLIMFFIGFLSAFFMVLGFKSGRDTGGDGDW